MLGAIKILFAEGGFGRYYAGLGPALFQGPIGELSTLFGKMQQLTDSQTARFGDTAANAGILALLSSNPFLAKLPSPLKTAFASVAAALFRMVLVPLDTLKVGVGSELARVETHLPCPHTDNDANAGLEWRTDLERSHQGLRDRNAVVRSLGDGGCLVRRQLPLVSLLSFSPFSSLTDPLSPFQQVCYVQLPLFRTPTTQYSTREARSAGVHRLRSLGRLRHHLQLASRGQDLPSSQSDAHQLQ